MTRWRSNWLDDEPASGWGDQSGYRDGSSGYRDRPGYGSFGAADGVNAPHENLLITTPEGGTRTLTVRYTDDDRAGADSVYRTRRVTDVATGSNYVLRRVAHPPQVGTGPNPYDLLDNEIQIGLHLIRALAGGGRYPQELSHLEGYNDRSDTPYLLLSERGRPLGQPPMRMRVEKKERFQANLMRALGLLAAAGVVHRCLTPATVRWGDPHVQITDFRYAALRGEPRGPSPVARWAAPESHSPGIATPSEDMWSAALVIVYLLTGRLPTGDGLPPDVSRMQVSFEHLHGAFHRVVRNRPRPQMVLDRLRQAPLDLSGFPPVADPVFEEGRDDFESLREDKAQRFAAMPPAESPPVPPAPPRPSPSRPALPRPASRPDESAGDVSDLPTMPGDDVRTRDGSERQGSGRSTSGRPL